jgi:hypothetical protein
MGARRLPGMGSSAAGAFCITTNICSINARQLARRKASFGCDLSEPTRMLHLITLWISLPAPHNARCGYTFAALIGSPRSEVLRFLAACDGTHGDMHVQRWI